MLTNQENIRQVLEELGINTQDQNFVDTPKRWVKFLRSYMQPYDPMDDLTVLFTEECKDDYEHSMVVQPYIPFRAVCAHHLLPILGHTHLGYIPRENVVGLSKLARVVYGISHRQPSLQENIGREIVKAFEDNLKPLGTMCVISAEHGCMACRGIEEPGIKTVTSSITGVFTHRPESRDEFYRLVNLGK